MEHTGYQHKVMTHCYNVVQDYDISLICENCERCVKFFLKHLKWKLGSQTLPIAVEDIYMAEQQRWFRLGFVECGICSRRVL